jgi:TolB protein
VVPTDATPLLWCRSWAGGEAAVFCEDMAEIIGNDLRSGVFEPIRRNMINTCRLGRCVYRDWQTLGAQYVLVGSMGASAGRLQISSLSASPLGSR